MAEVFFHVRCNSSRLFGRRFPATRHNPTAGRPIPPIAGRLLPFSMRHFGGGKLRLNFRHKAWNLRSASA
jgi:hypothetical protein